MGCCCSTCGKGCAPKKEAEKPVKTEKPVKKATADKPKK